MDPLLSSIVIRSRCIITLESSLGNMVFLVSCVQSPSRLVFRLSALEYPHWLTRLELKH